MSSSETKKALFGQFATVAKAMGHGHRLELVEFLAQGERSVEALARLTELSVANASQHLQQLRRAGLVRARKSGHHVLYRLADEAGRGAFRGPLHGIPVGIKDIIDVAGLPTRAASPLRDGHRAADDAPLVAGLKRAGAVVLGKTVTTAFASFDPPPTRNPWDLSRTPGGSSSGCLQLLSPIRCSWRSRAARTGRISNGLVTMSAAARSFVSA